MVLHKRFDYGFNGYQVLVIPRAARSARRRRSYAKKVDDNQMCAFDLLATVAGKLLLETESSHTAVDTLTGKDNCTTSVVEKGVKMEYQDEEKPLKIEQYDKGRGDGKLLVPGTVSHTHDQNYDLKESQHSQNDEHSGLTSVLTGSECSKRVCAQKMEIDGNISETIGCKVDEGSPAYLDTGDCKLENEINIVKKESDNMPIDIRAEMCSLDKPVTWDGKPAAGISSDSSSKGPLYKEHAPYLSYSPSWDVNVVSRDDDENSSGCTHPGKAMGCTHPSPKARFFRPSPQVRDQRSRRLLASKYWKVAPKSKNQELQNTVFPNREMKSVRRNRKNCYKRQRSLRNYPFKKTKILYHRSISNSNGDVCNGSISNLSGKGSNGDVSGSDLKMHAATRTSSSVAGQHSSFQSRDSHVKLRIQSFRVPELFIEIPETATVGSLKRTVMEAVNAILGGGLHVGLLLQGKKVRDDHRTLQQTGISQDKHLEALGFSLEPTLSQVSSHLGSEDTSFLRPSDTTQPLTSYLSSVHKGSTDTSSELHVANLDICVESDHDSAPSLIDSSVDKNTDDSKELVVLPAMSMETLAMVPAHHNSKRSEIAERRIRRPFSVTEVEALVQAVEKLGIGRWRDVKLRAFDNAKHRTYVDLKDKWKTLVHTARIAPQQRRGEAVPQELLDRVLAAHGYWTRQQTLILKM